MNFRNATTSSLVIVFAIASILFTPEIRAECPPVFTFHGEGPYHWFGSAVADAGDIDGDGFSDILIGAQFYRVDSTSPAIGRAYIYSGLDGSLIRTIDGESGEFGQALTGIGDINNDGRDDIAVCAPGNYRVYVFSGLTGDTIYTLNGDSTIYGFGRSIDGEGDANGDGYSDILVGSGGIFDTGRVYVYSGRTGELIFEKVGQMAGDLFGSSVSWVGDVNNDGSDDFAVGAWRHNANGFESGRLYVYSGKTGDILYTFDGDENSQVGQAKFGGADLNGDSHADIIFSSKVPAPGIIRAHSGIDGSLLYLLEDSSPHDEIFGGAVELVYNLARDNKYILLTFGFDGVVIGGLGVERVYA
ncbi:MAG: FG-GAP repeat protein, partial [candidate division Zixibacteria bacterium]|nr:FG-GAP repeat protein [candidate division Zixibacteria bacterium]